MVSGHWSSGALNEASVPHTYTRDAAEPGGYTLFDGVERSGYHTVGNESPAHQFLTGINTPSWREWAEDVQVSPHIWRARLPEDLEAGEHTAEITGTNVHGQTWTETVTFTVTD